MENQAQQTHRDALIILTFGVSGSKNTKSLTFQDKWNRTTPPTWPLWAAASTHPGEEKLVIDAYLALRERGLESIPMLPFSGPCLLPRPADVDPNANRPQSGAFA